MVQISNLVVKVTESDGSDDTVKCDLSERAALGIEQAQLLLTYKATKSFLNLLSGTEWDPNITDQRISLSTIQT